MYHASTMHIYHASSNSHISKLINCWLPLVGAPGPSPQREALGGSPCRGAPAASPPGALGRGWPRAVAQQRGRSVEPMGPPMGPTPPATYLQFAGHERLDGVVFEKILSQEIIINHLHEIRDHFWMSRYIIIVREKLRSWGLCQRCFMLWRCTAH